MVPPPVVREGERVVCPITAGPNHEPLAAALLPANPVGNATLKLYEDGPYGTMK
jgi:hypothetical protein